MEVNDERKLRQIGAIAGDIVAALEGPDSPRSRRAAIDMVRHAMKRAVKNGDLKCYRQRGKNEFDQDETFHWASNRWPACAGKLSFNLTIQLTGNAAIFTAGSGRPSTLVRIPGDPDELREVLMAVETRAFLAMGADLGCWWSRAIRG